jgi:hypothetical protein
MLAVTACGDDPGADASRADGDGTAFRSDPAFDGWAVTSPPIDVSTARPVLVSTSGAVVLGGGSRSETGHPDPEVRVLDRTTNTWSDLPPLPEPTYVFAGVAVDDVPYFLGSPCPDLPATGADLIEDCHGAVAHRLVDDGSRWETIVPPDDVYDPDRELATAGLVGDRGLAFLANGPDGRGFAVLDVAAGTWSSVAQPDGGRDGFLIPCFTLGRLHMRSLSSPRVFTPDAVDEPERYAFEAWALDGTRWAGPVRVDLGPVVPSGQGSQLCSGGVFVAKNPSAGGTGAALVPDGPELREVGLVDGERWVAGRGPDRAAIVEDGRVVTVAHDGALATTPEPVVEPAVAAFATGETADLVDLLVGEEEAGRLTVVTVRRG